MRALAQLTLISGITALLAGCGDAEVADAPVTDVREPSRLEEVAAAEAQERAERERPRPLLTRTPGEGFLSAERIHTTALSGTPLRKTTISPDGTRVGYLRGSEADPDQQDLWAIDVETGEKSLLVSSTDLLGAPEVLSEEEKNRRERAREYGRGIIDYSWVDAETLLFPLGGDVYLFDLSTGEARQVTATEGFESDIKLSASKSYVAYVRDDELYVTDLDTGLERQITRGSSDVVRNGVASFVVQEELARDTGYWLGPDEARVAYTRIDESPIAIDDPARIWGRTACAPSSSAIPSRERPTPRCSCSSRHWTDAGSQSKPTSAMTRTSISRAWRGPRMESGSMRAC